MLMLLLGFAVASIGTLIGVGGGFLLIPILLYLYPDKGHAWIAATSMWVVAWNATSGTIAYYRRGTVHVRAALLFILASLPGSWLGVWIEQLISRSFFELAFGFAAIIYSVLLFFKKNDDEEGPELTPQSKLALRFYVKGCVISFFVGFVASFFGIGGGVVHVPLLSHVLGFPVHLATGTSHSILAITAWFTTLFHLWQGDLDLGHSPIYWQLGFGAVLGAQVGAHYSRRVSGAFILRLLSVALFLVGLRLVFPLFK